MNGTKTSLAIYNELGKDVRNRSNCTPEESWETIGRARVHTERLEMRLDLLSPESEQQFRAALWWMAEQGIEEDLKVLKRIRELAGHLHKDPDNLIEMADERIRVRENDPHRLVRRGEAVYQQNEVKWRKEYGGSYIAIRGGKIIDSDPDESKLLRRMNRARQTDGRFRAYIRKVGRSVLEARGPRIPPRPPPLISWLRRGY